MNSSQCVPFVGCKVTIPKSPENGLSLKQIDTSLKDKDERICCILIFDVNLFFKQYSRKKSSNEIIYLL